MRIWLTPEQAEILNTPIGLCHHRRHELIWAGTTKNSHGVIHCLGCGNYFDFLGHTDSEVTDEAEAIEINRTRINRSKE